MDDDNRNWPVILGIAVGLLGGVAAGMYLYSVKHQSTPVQKLRDAKEIVAQCYGQIQEIEQRLADIQ